MRNEQQARLVERGDPDEPVAPASTEPAPQDAAGRQQGDLVELPAPSFRVCDAASASWVVRKVNEARAYAKRVEVWAAAELRRAEREEQWLLRRFGRELEEWLRTEIRGGRRRSVCLPGGTLGLRQSPPRILVVDEPRVVAWCAGRLPQALKVRVEVQGDAAMRLVRWRDEHVPGATVKQDVLIGPLRAHVEETGELPPGVDVRPPCDQLYVK